MNCGLSDETLRGFVTVAKNTSRGFDRETNQSIANALEELLYLRGRVAQLEKWEPKDCTLTLEQQELMDAHNRILAKIYGSPSGSIRK